MQILTVLLAYVFCVCSPRFTTFLSVRQRQLQERPATTPIWTPTSLSPLPSPPKRYLNSSGSVRSGGIEEERGRADIKEQSVSIASAIENATDSSVPVQLSSEQDSVGAAAVHSDKLQDGESKQQVSLGVEAEQKQSEAQQETVDEPPSPIDEDDDEFALRHSEEEKKDKNEQQEREAVGGEAATAAQTADLTSAVSASQLSVHSSSHLSSSNSEGALESSTKQLPMVESEIISSEVVMTESSKETDTTEVRMVQMESTTTTTIATAQLEMSSVQLSGAKSSSSISSHASAQSDTSEQSHGHHRVTINTAHNSVKVLTPTATSGELNWSRRS